MQSETRIRRKLLPTMGYTALLLVLAVGAGVWIVQKRHTSVGQSDRVAKHFTLPDQQGKMHSLESLRGNVILLHFWASWCPPCLDELPVLIRFAKKVARRNIRIVFVSLDHNWAEAMKVFPLDPLPVNTLSLLDPSSGVAEQYGAFQYPETFLISTDLEVKTKWIGPQKWDDDEIVRAFDQAKGW